MNINEKDLAYETFLIGEFPFTLLCRVTEMNTYIYGECDTFDNYKSNFITARNRLLKKLENLNNEK